MVDLSVILLFAPTFFLASVTPGMCMTLAMTMGMTYGVKRTMWMMAGELLGLTLVAVSAVLGVAIVMLNYPQIFSVFKLLGGSYLAYLGVQMWRAKGRMAITADPPNRGEAGRVALIVQGFLTAAANPKGWAFFLTLLPPFIDSTKAIGPQLSVLLIIIVGIEFACMLMYASGGERLRSFMNKGGNIRAINRFAGSLMIAIGLWLAFG